MEANKIYQDSIFLLANLIKNEKLRVDLLNDIEFKKQAVELVNDLLILEIDENCTFKDQKWGAIFGKALVNITKEKIKFVKPDNKKADDVLSDVTYLQTFCFNNLQISRESLTDQTFELTEEFVKENSKITDEMKEKYSKASDKSNVEPEVVDKTKEKPNTSQSSGFEQFAGAQSAQGNPFMGSIPPHPMQDPRFYPYNAKPTYTKWLKLAIGVSLGLIALFSLLLTIFLSIQSYVLNADKLEGFGFDKDFISKWNEFLKINKLGNSWTINLGVYVSGEPGQLPRGGVTSIIFEVIICVIMAYLVFSIIQPPKSYRLKFVIPWTTLFIPGMFVVMMLIQFWTPMMYMFGQDIPGKYFTALFTDIDKIEIKPAITETFTLNNEALSAMLNDMAQNFNTTLIKVLLGFMFASLILSAITVFVILGLNPRIDRAKISRANEEYQTMISEAMQGRKYEIDSSLYESKEDIDAFLKEIKDRQEKKNNKNKDKDQH